MNPILILATVAAAASDGTVTLPLDAYAALRADKKPVAAPPVSALVVAQRLSARPAVGGIELHAHFAVQVLADTDWAKVCVLKVGPGVQLAELPRLDNATLAPLGGELCLLSRTVGTYDFDVQLLARGTRIGAGKDALWTPLEFEGQSVDPQSGEWLLPKPKRVVAEERPPLEPTCTSARAELVSTVEGHAQLQVSYRLQLDREQPIAFASPRGWKVERVTVNAVARKGGLEFPVAPMKDNEAVVELKLSRELGVFHLSGKLDFELPQVSWPVAKVEASVVLPKVFEYRRVGGSLEPTPDGEVAVVTSFPGKAMAFTQHLVAAAAPTLELDYSVDLTGRYFTTRPAP